LEEAYSSLKARWLAGERDRRAALHLMYYAWMNAAEPSYVTGMTEDPEATSIWRECFEFFGGANSDDLEFLYVSAIMLELFGFLIFDERVWQIERDSVLTTLIESQNKITECEFFSDKSDYSDYFQRHFAHVRESGFDFSSFGRE
jgi:hypothetical protein